MIVSLYAISNAAAHLECPFGVSLTGISAVHGKDGTRNFCMATDRTKELEQEKERSAQRATLLYQIEKALASTSSWGVFTLLSCTWTQQFTTIFIFYHFLCFLTLLTSSLS